WLRAVSKSAGRRTPASVLVSPRLWQADAAPKADKPRIGVEIVQTRVRGSGRRADNSSDLCKPAPARRRLGLFHTGPPRSRPRCRAGQSAIRQTVVGVFRVAQAPVTAGKTSAGGSARLSKPQPHAAFCG